MPLFSPMQIVGFPMQWLNYMLYFFHKRTAAAVNLLICVSAYAKVWFSHDAVSLIYLGITYDT